MPIAVILSILAMSAIIAVRYFASSGLFALATQRVRPGHYAALTPPDQAGDRLVARFRADLRHSGGDRRLGLAAFRLDADLRGVEPLPAMVSAAIRPDLSVCARYVVLLDPSPDASPALLSRCPCRTPRQPPHRPLGPR